MLKKTHLFLLARYLQPQWRWAFAMSLFLLGSIAFQAFIPQVLRRFIDLVSNRGEGVDLTLTAVTFLGVVLAGQAVSGLAVYTSAVVAWEATNRLRTDLALHCLQLDMRFHYAHVPGEMIQRIDGDVGILGNFFSQFAVQIAANGILVLVIFTLIFRENVWVALILVLYVAAAFRVLLKVQKAGKDSFDRVRKIQSRAVGFWEEMLTVREDVKPLGAFRYVLRRNAEMEYAMFPDGRLSSVLFRAYVVALAAVFVIGNAIAMAIGAYLYGRGQATIGGVFLLLSYTNLLAAKVGNIANQSNDFQQALVAIHRVSELANTTSPLVDGPGAFWDGKAPSVDFENVTFAYTEETPVLRDLTFHLGGGQRMGLLGRTGAGKSTIVRLLFRFFDPERGSIRLDGVDLREARLSELRGVVGMVTQEVQLFHASARDNLTLFDRSIPDQHIWEVLDDLGLGGWLRRLGEGLDTLLTGGEDLSAGEAQLVAFARVFLQDPRLVILDEASSRLDPATEARLERAIDRLLQGRTAIIIAHRLNTLRKVEHVLVLESGCLVEYGPRDRLEEDKRSEYHRLLNLGEEVLE